MGRAIAALIALLLAAAPFPGAAQTLAQCNIGEEVTDSEGRTGVIVAKNGDVCGLRYADGQIRAWAAWSLRPALVAPPREENSIVLRPYIERKLVYHADRSGHFSVAATANGAPLRFLVDTGATLVFLTPADARASGVDLDGLKFDQTASTGNGSVRIARIVLPDIRIGDLTVERVPAAVIQSIPQSVLGMSFLARLKSFSIESGTLTLEW